MSIDNIKIDYNTANVVIPIASNGEELQILVPPLPLEEIRANALVLGEFFGLFDTINPIVLLADYDVYLEEVIDTITLRKYNDLKDTYAIKYKEDLVRKIGSLLERLTVGAYYVDKNNELKTADTLHIDAIRVLKGSLLFFIVMHRYARPNLSEQDWVQRIKDMKMYYTSLSAMEWKNTLKTPLKTEETSGQLAYTQPVVNQATPVVNQNQVNVARQQ